MAEPNIDISAFKNPDGTNYRLGEKLNLGSVKAFLIEKNYNVISLNQEGRYIFGRLQQQNQSKDYFFKLATTEGLNQRLKNEISWTTNIYNQIQNQKINFFKVPQILETGKIDKYNYYLAEFIDYPLLAEKRTFTHKPEPKDIQKFISKIIQTNRFIDQLPKFELFLDMGVKPDTAKRSEEFYTKNSSWYDTRVKAKYNLDNVLEEVKNFSTNLEFGLNHGDLVPWNILAKDGELIVLDGEHASFYKPKYYDVVYMYHRLYTSLELPELAKDYINQYRISLAGDKVNDFDDKFRTIIAGRIIGGLWDAINDKIENLEFHELLLKDFHTVELY